MQNNESTLKGFFERLLGGGGRTVYKDRVREYIVHRARHGACLEDVLREDYVQRNCSRDEIGEILRDPRLIHEEREQLERLFEDGRLDPTLVPRRR